MILIRLLFIIILIALLWAYAGYCFGSIKDPNGLADVNDLREFVGHWMRPEVSDSILQYRYDGPKWITPSILLRIQTTDPNCTDEWIERIAGKAGEK